MWGVGCGVGGAVRDSGSAEKAFGRLGYLHTSVCSMLTCRSQQGGHWKKDRDRLQCRFCRRQGFHLLS